MPYIIALKIPLDLVLLALVKYETVIGIIGNTHGVSNAAKPLKKEIKNNILKSMWLYAASEGFTVFNKNESTTFLLSSSYIKCAA